MVIVVVVEVVVVELVSVHLEPSLFSSTKPTGQKHVNEPSVSVQIPLSGSQLSTPEAHSSMLAQLSPSPW